MYRILRAVKNRFGATNEMGVFEMVQSGLKEVANPLLTCLKEEASTAVERSRPVLWKERAQLCLRCRH